jgi:hypothetical protein
MKLTILGKVVVLVNLPRIGYHEREREREREREYVTNGKLNRCILIFLKR